MSSTSKIWLNEATDDLVIEILKIVVPVLETVGIDYFIVGAFAWDLGMKAKGFDQSPPRKTKDIDLAVMVGTLSDYDALKKKIAALPDFEPDEKEPYRFIFKGAYEVDFLPFGEIKNEKGQVILTKTCVLDMPGFQEVEPWTVHIETKEGIRLRVSSLAGVVLLKLYAWEDRPVREKDIQDIDYILKNFYLLNVEDIIVADADLLELCQGEKYYDEAISARYIGRQISRMLKDSPQLKQRVENLLEKNTSGSSMARLMDFPTLEDGQNVIKAMYLGLFDNIKEDNA